MADHETYRGASRALRQLTRPDRAALATDSARTYFILPAPQHVERLTARVLDFLDTEWGERGHFTLFEAVQ